MRTETSGSVTLFGRVAELVSQDPKPKMWGSDREIRGRIPCNGLPLVDAKYQHKSGKLLALKVFKSMQVRILPRPPKNTSRNYSEQ